MLAAQIHSPNAYRDGVAIMEKMQNDECFCFYATGYDVALCDFVPRALPDPIPRTVCIICILFVDRLIGIIGLSANSSFN